MFLLLDSFKMQAKVRGNPSKALWLGRLSSALRTALACTIVACTTLYGPARLRHLLAYPAFSYVTTILIASDATLGDALRGCWHALYATVQVAIPSAMTLWAIGPANFTNELAAVEVHISAFMVALPESTPLLAKRIAAGQFVIVYVGAVIHGAETEVLMHSIHVASSAALGALASVLAMLFPYPRLAVYEVRKAYGSYLENAAERLNLYVEAFAAQDNQAACDLIYQAKLLERTGARHLQTVKDGEVAIAWEKPQVKFLKPNCKNPREILQEIEIPLRGMEIALTSSPSFPIGVVDEKLREVLQTMTEKLDLKLQQAKCFAPLDTTTAPEITGESLENSRWDRRTGDKTPEDLPAFHFLHCMQLLQDDSPFPQSPECIVQGKKKVDTDEQSDSAAKATQRLGKTWSSVIAKPRARWTFAIKCSISLGFAVIFGLIFNKENAYWSGLTIAISFETGRQATFTVANARGQGTAMGSVYGILGCFAFQRFEKLRCLILLPWIIFTGFLRHSRMYGQPGAISAVIGALLILGRNNYGPPKDFAITRITEACIGLLCFVIIEILVQPARAASQAKTELSWSLGALQDCIEEIVLCTAGTRREPLSIAMALREKQKKLKSHREDLERFTAEAKSEPNFWFLPFNGACYDKLTGSLQKIEDLLLFVTCTIETLSKVSGTLAVEWETEVEYINDDLDNFRDRVSSLLKCTKEVILMKSLSVLEEELQKKNPPNDIESGKLPDADAVSRLGLDETEVSKIMASFLQHSEQVASKVNACEGEEKLKNKMILCLTSLGFCINSIMKETTEIHLELKELITWENPTRRINMHEIICKINALRPK